MMVMLTLILLMTLTVDGRSKVDCSKDTAVDDGNSKVDGGSDTNDDRKGGEDSEG